MRYIAIFLAATLVLTITSCDSGKEQRQKDLIDAKATIGVLESDLNDTQKELVNERAKLTEQDKLVRKYIAEVEEFQKQSTGTLLKLGAATKKYKALESQLKALESQLNEMNVKYSMLEREHEALELKYAKIFEEPWKYRANWLKIKVGMSAPEVEKILGPPIRRTVAYSAYNKYPGKKIEGWWWLFGTGESNPAKGVPYDGELLFEKDLATGEMKVQKLPQPKRAFFDYWGNH